MSDVQTNFDEGLTSISKAVLQLDDIENIRLNVQHTTTTEQGLKAIALCLREKEGIQQLALGFGQTQQKSDEGILCLADAVNIMRKLLRLHISLEGTDIPQNG